VGRFLVPRALLAFAIAERAFAIHTVLKCRWCCAPHGGRTSKNSSRSGTSRRSRR
jgi:hypothetical protein